MNKYNQISGKIFEEVYVAIIQHADSSITADGVIEDIRNKVDAAVYSSVGRAIGNKQLELL